MVDYLRVCCCFGVVYRVGGICWLGVFMLGCLLVFVIVFGGLRLVWVWMVWLLLSYGVVWCLFLVLVVGFAFRVMVFVLIVL